MSYTDSDFHNAPDDWSMKIARKIALEHNIDMHDDQWEVVIGLQEYFSRHEFCNRRELVDALDEKFHVKGGTKYLYRLFPGGPVAQGCVISGLTPPAGSVDKSFGSVV